MPPIEDESESRNGPSPAEDPNARYRPSVTYIQGPPETVIVSQGFGINLLIIIPEDDNQPLASNESNESDESDESGQGTPMDIRITVLDGETEVAELEDLEGLPLMDNADGGNFVIEDLRIRENRRLVSGRQYTLQVEVEVDGYSSVSDRRTFRLERRLANGTYGEASATRGDANGTNGNANEINGRENGS
ncbi:hypothetical protein VTN96DRAFT_5728 [Rasamsonia emersonii]